jgi:hypothetical protein
MAKDESRENAQERESRLLLNVLLTTVDPLLDRLLARIVLDSKEATTQRDGQQLHRIWNASDMELRAQTSACRSPIDQNWFKQNSPQSS